MELSATSARPRSRRTRAAPSNESRAVISTSDSLVPRTTPRRDEGRRVVRLSLCPWGNRRSKAVWLKLAKKTSGIPSVTHAEALDVALCYGWIDGQGSSYDDDHWLARFTPRRPKSRWSKVNQGKVAELIATGRMRPAGLAAI